MMKQAARLILILGLMLGNTVLADVVVSGVKVPGRVDAGGQALALNGAGIRSKYFMDMYVGALYVTQKSGDGKALADLDQAMSMRIQIVSSLITSEKMVSATLEGFEKSLNGKTAPLKKEIDRFVSVFNREPIKQGDVYLVTYVPGTGVRVDKNGKLQDTIAGLPFKKALFGMWVGPNPVDDGLKAGLLGK